MPFQVKIEATKGLLLGGVKIHRSAPFIQEGNAAAWAAQCARTNEQAGRPCTVKIIPVMRPRRECADYSA